MGLNLIHGPKIQGAYARLFFIASPPDTSTAEPCFYFGSATSFFLELLVIALHFLSSTGHLPTWGAHLLASYLFFLFILFSGFSRQEYWSGLPLSPPVDHILSELFTMICLFWLTPHGMAHSFTELRKPFHHDRSLGA